MPKQIDRTHKNLSVRTLGTEDSPCVDICSHEFGLDCIHVCDLDEFISFLLDCRREIFGSAAPEPQPQETS